MRSLWLITNLLLNVPLCLMLLGGQVVAQPAQPQSAQDHFRSGTAAFQKGEYEKARAEFLKSLSSQPNNATTLYNLGLAEQKLGRPGYALAFWRKALTIEPRYQNARHAVNWTRGKLAQPEIPHEVEEWETFREALLVPVTLDHYLLGCAVLLFASGWLLLRYFGQRRRAKLEERPLPGYPWLATIVAVGFVVAVGLSVAKAVDQEIVRGTIVEKKIEARSSPDSSATPLFDLYEGLEVIVRQRQNDWVQVTYPGASTGWIPKASIIATSDRVAP